MTQLLTQVQQPEYDSVPGPLVRVNGLVAKDGSSRVSPGEVHTTESRSASGEPAAQPGSDKDPGLVVEADVRAENPGVEQGDASDECGLRAAPTRSDQRQPTPCTHE